MPARVMTQDGWRAIGMFSAWGGALLVVLQLQELPYDFGHGICGPWGCGPPVSALLACHAFWLVNLAAVLWITHHWCEFHWQRQVAGAALTVATIGLLSVAAHQAIFWWPAATQWSRPYVAQRYLFSIAMLVDVPLVQLALFGLAGLRLSHRRAMAEFAAIRVQLPPDDAPSDTCEKKVGIETGRGAHDF